MSVTRRLTPRRSRLRALAGHDFAPEFSAKARRLVGNPLGVLLLAGLASLLCGLFLHAQGFVLCGGVLAVVALGVIWPWLTLRGVSGVVGFDRPRCSEGETVGATLSLANRLPWAAWGLAVRGGFGDDARPAAAVASAPRRRAAVCRWAFTPARRGVYPLAPPRLTTGFPFGLWENARRLAVAAPLTVWPRTFPVGPVPPAGGEHSAEGNVSRGRVGTTGDVAGVRPYRRGDSPRRVHWGQSAKHDRLVVCELESNPRPVIRLVLDADPGVHGGSSREWAIRVAASFARGWLGDGAQVGLAWGDFDLPPAAGQAQLNAILDALAALPDDTPTPLARLLAAPGLRDGLEVVVTTDRANPEPGTRNPERGGRRWVVLESAGFAGPAAAPGRGPTPWLSIDSPENVPALLKGGWREARHGS